MKSRKLIESLISLFTLVVLIISFPSFSYALGPNIGSSVNILDLSLVFSKFDLQEFAYDFSGNGKVDLVDISILLGKFGITSGFPTGSTAMNFSFEEGDGDTTTDASIQGNNGNLAGSQTCPGPTACPNWETVGKIGKALSFDGVDDYVEVNDSNSIDANGDFTISAWVKSSQTPVTDVWPFIVFKETGSQLTGYEIAVLESDLDNRWYGAIVVADTYYTVHGSSNITDGVWHHIVFQRSGATLKTYQDGQLANTTSSVTADLTNSSNLLLGSSGGSDYYNGSIDEFKFYNFALSSDQVLTEYNKGNPTLLSGLVGYWKFDDNVAGESKTVLDSSGNSNNGTTSNGGNLSGMDCTVVGKFNLGCSFDGIDDFINIGTSPILNLTEEYTLSAWVKTSVVNTYRDIVGRWDRPGNRQYALNINNSDKAEFTTTTQLSLAGTTTITDGAWHQIVATYKKGQSANIYVDGNLENSNNAPPDTPSIPGLSFQIGVATDEFYMNGSIDDVRLYNRALSPSEVLDLYNLVP